MKLTERRPDKESGTRIVGVDELNNCLNYFQSQGYNEVDTARAYIGGKQEGLTAQAGWKDRGLTLATKHYPFEPGQHSPEKLKAALTTSLAALKTSTVDIFYLHAADRSKPSALC